MKEWLEMAATSIWAFGEKGVGLWDIWVAPKEKDRERDLLFCRAPK